VDIIGPEKFRYEKKKERHKMGQILVGVQDGSKGNQVGQRGGGRFKGCAICVEELETHKGRLEFVVDSATRRDYAGKVECFWPNSRVGFGYQPPGMGQVMLRDGCAVWTPWPPKRGGDWRRFWKV